VARWEVSIVIDQASKQVVARDVLAADLVLAVEDAQERIRRGAYIHPEWKVGAISITRMDCTSEARRAKWEADFYDIDKAGRRRRRYKKPEVERQWEAWVKAEAKTAREARKVSNDTYSQRR